MRAVDGKQRIYLEWPNLQFALIIPARVASKFILRGLNFQKVPVGMPTVPPVWHATCSLTTFLGLATALNKLTVLLEYFV